VTESSDTPKTRPFSISASFNTVRSGHPDNAAARPPSPSPAFSSLSGRRLADFLVFRYLAAGHQDRHDDRHVPDGVSYSEHAEPRWRGAAPLAPV
jgi:hypothetical protein